MCQCDPRIRTPFCGKPGCEWPEAEACDEDDCQPAYICDHCRRPAKNAVAITLTPWALGMPAATAGWICGECHGFLRIWLGDERDEATTLTPDQEACLRMGDQLCDWQTRAIEAERKLKERP